MSVILKGATVLDPATAGEALVDVAITGSRISCMAPTISPSSHDNVIALQGRFLLPGFINCHSHLGWDGVGDLEEESLQPGPLGVWRGYRNAVRCIRAGITTVRDLGMNDVGPVVAHMSQAGDAAGLRVIPVGRAITMTGGHTWWCCREADGVSDCRSAVREQAKVGAKWIKVMASHYWPQMGSSHGPVEQWTDLELVALVEEAHGLGLKVTFCVGSEEAIKRVARAGADCIEHGGTVGDDVIELLVERGIWLVTTFSPLVLQARFGLDAGMPLAAVEHRRRQLEDEGRFDGVRRMAQQGVRVGFGTDAGSPLVPHGEIVPELQMMLDTGVCRDSWAALRSITSSSAELLGLDEDLGSIAVGKVGDVVALDMDPRGDMEALRSVCMVMVNGAVVYSR